MIKREKYLEILERFKDKELIKVVTGIRRCGKSTLFKLFIEKLVFDGVSEDNIIHINLEDMMYDDYHEYKKLYYYINSKLINNNKYYIFLDEVQVVEQFQKVVDSLYIKENVDIYITGSNCSLLSGELATFLTGRYIEVKMLPLSFKEYKTAISNENLNNYDLYSNYISNGSFPYTLKLETEDDISIYLKSLYDTIVLKDIVYRKKYPDHQMFQSVVSFMLDNISNLVSTNNIAEVMKKSGRDISVHTVESYLTSLTDAFMFYKVNRYDVKGLQLLKSGNKYYVSDLGLRYFLLNRKIESFGYILENVVFLELFRRGYEIYIGKVDKYEIDFIAISSKKTIYYQVSYSIANDETFNREIRPLELLKNHHAKILLTMDKIPVMDKNGIKIMNAIDWLLCDDDIL